MTPSWFRLSIALFAAAAAVAASADPASVTSVRHIERYTPLRADARPPALLLPDDPAYGAAATLLTQGLAAAGIRAEPAADVAAADPAARTVICVGSMLNNPLIERLYWNRYTFVDALTPSGPSGPAGEYLLHTVYDPYPFNGGHNVIVIGCHDPAGAEAGVKRFLSLIGNGRFPYIVEVGPQPAVSDAEAARIAASAPNPTLSELEDNVTGYLRTGSPAYARKAISAMDLVAKLYAPGGERRTKKDSFYIRLPWNEETHSWQILCAWDAFEECPFLSDAQRLAFSNALLQFTRDLVTHVSGYGEIGVGDTIAWNHTTYPLLGIDAGARYFYRYYRMPDMAGMLEKARACFLAQARSWKPKEDADTYMSYTMGHVLTYCLAENQLDYLKRGNLQRFADYIVSIADNTGQTSGFGDSNSMAGAPHLADTVLPVALWWSRDGGYKWLMDRYTNGRWRNPYDRGIPSARPDRLTGVDVFPLDPQVYAYTQSKPFYSEPVVHADVPASEAFDKIAFRENWDPAGQYLLVDGFARGKHLHYDGNSIVEFVEGGERWLIDHDYYTQNTTEHTMLSILRDGRCAETEPSMSGLAKEADLPGWGYTRTYVRAYNGCDWQRQILWRKSGWFLVADAVTPTAAGDYTFDLTWKTMDCGSQRIDERGDFVTAHGLTAERTRDCSIVDSSEPGGSSLQVDDTGAQIVFGANLPEGRYSLAVIGNGGDANDPNEHTDSLRVSVDGGPAQWFSATPGESPAKPGAVDMAGPGVHTIVAWPASRHGPLRIDRFVFTDAAGRRHVCEAAHLPPPPSPDPALARRLWIKPVGTVESWITGHHPEGIAVPVTILHQRQAGRLGASQTTRFASLFFVSRPGAVRDLRPVRVGENLVAVQGTDPGLALLGNVEAEGLSAAADAGLVTPETLAFAALRRFRAGDVSISSSALIDLEMDLSTGRGSVLAPAGGAEVEISLGTRKQSFHLAGGRGEIAMAAYESPAKEKRLVETLLRPRPPSEAAPQPERNRSDRPAWTVIAPDSEIKRMEAADLGDGKGVRLFVCSGRTLQCLSLQGSQLWKFTAAGRARSVAFGELRPTPGREVLVGSTDTYIYVLSADGRLLEKRQMRGAPWNKSFGDDAYGVYQIGVWDLKGDGKNDIVATLGNSDMQVYDADWRLLWKAKDAAMHGTLQLSFEDLDGDGRPETLLTGDNYGYCAGVDTNGDEVYRGRSSIGTVAYAVASSGGKGRRIVTASSGGDLMGTSTEGWWGAAGGVDMSTRKLAAHRALWRFDNWGYPVSRIRTGDLNGDGRSEVVIAGGGGYLYALDVDGKVLWQNRTGHCVNDLIVFGPPGGKRVAYCDESGTVGIADAHGHVIREIRLPSPGRLVREVSTPSGSLIVVALADGRVAAYDLW